MRGISTLVQQENILYEKTGEKSIDYVILEIHSSMRLVKLKMNNGNRNRQSKKILKELNISYQ